MKAEPKAGASDTTRVWHALTPEQTLAALQTSADGISDAEAEARRARHGPNVLRARKPRSAWRILLDQLRSVVVILLAVAAAVAYLVGDPLDAAAILAVLVINTVLGFVTEMRARRAMEALLRLEVPRATVVRGGEAREIDAAELVPGDVIELEAGAAVPADARLIEAKELRTNEAALTGESTPVDKRAEAVLEPDIPLPDHDNRLYKATTVAAGSARAVVVATGMETELGRIGGLAGEIEAERTPLEHRLDALGRGLVWLAFGVGAVVVALGVLRDQPLMRLIETGIALAIAAVPEGLPAVSTIALAVGVRRMARRNALVRRLPAVEALGSVTVICTDKTGTLTAGQMTVTTVRVGGREFELTGVGYSPEEGGVLEDGRPVEAEAVPALERALRIGALANAGGLERDEDGRWTVRGDPTDGALLVAAAKAGLDRETVSERWPQVGEIPFSSERMLMATFHESPDGGRIAMVKGAPGRIVELSARVLEDDGRERPMEPADREALLETNRELAARGLRVLALADSPVDRPDEAALRDLTFVGFVGMIDPVAEGVPETISQFRGAGIRPVMLTGDQRVTAEAIARELRMVRPGDRVLDGREFERMGEAELAEGLGRVAAFSRIGPEDKLRIVTGYQRRGDIVAMLGDGVNDAVALKKADIGVAMGRRGTDVAKEAATVVLQDDRFATIGAAVEEGRAIFDNIRKFVFYLFSCNLAEVLVLVGASAAGLPLPLFPLQILWLNLVTDTFPALSLAVEPAEPEIMRRRPRDPERAILSAGFVRLIGFYGVLITAVTLVAFFIALGDPAAESGYAVTVSFMTLALAQTFHLGNARSVGPVVGVRAALANRYAIGAVVLVLGLQLLAVYFPPLATVLRLVPLAPGDWLVIVPLSLAPAVVGQAIKLVRRGGSADDEA
ncbi:MAG: cation-translocating P-type ATPase [Gemmatimonadota bacterium]